MQSAHNGYYKGSIPFGLKNQKKKLRIKIIRVLGRVWFMALVLKTSTSKKA